MIDKPTIARIMDSTKIEEVVSEFVTLKKRGINYIGLCPFHNDSHPSFSVSPTRGICHCFTCGKGGNAINFLMELEQMTYPDALRWLAKKYNIEIQEREMTNEEKQRESERESMYIVNDWAAKYFQDILQNDVDGRAIGMQYFRSRGFRDDIIRKFQLGFALPQRTALFDEAVKKGYNPKYLTATGLCFKVDKDEAGNRSGQDQYLDRFSGRAIFPWTSVSGKIVAFGGRVLDSRTKGVNQKYVNSPDSEIYHKERELYGLYQAKKAIAKEDCVYMVEGYTDVISMHQCGIENVVANSGTALSTHQIKLLRRFTPNIVLLYDGDEAGQHAALRGTDMLLSEGMNVKVLLLPDGKDPDELARSYSAEDFRKYIEENQTDFIVFKINVLLKGVSDPVKRSEAINSIVQSVAVIKDPILRDTYLRECAHRTGVKEETLIAQMNRYIHSDREQQRKEQERRMDATPIPESVPRTFQVATPAQQASKVETMLVQAIVRDGEKIIIRDIPNEETGTTVNLNVAQYIAYDLGLDNLSFSNPVSIQILQEAVEHSSDEGFKAEEYFTHHSDINLSTLAVKLSVDRFQLSESLQLKERETDLRDRIIHLILDFRMDYVEQHLKALQTKLAQEQDIDKMMAIMGELKNMQEMRNILAKKLGTDIVIR